MKNKDIFNLVQSGVKPIIRVVNDKKIEESIWDNGMIGKIERAFIEEEYRNNEVIKFYIREDSFRKINEPVMKCNYYDKDGNPTLNYIDSGVAPENGLEITYCMGNDTVFELVNNSEFLVEYLKEEHKETYVEYLENRLKNCLNKA
jgi:hypothetical protein